MFNLPACQAQVSEDDVWWMLRANWIYSALTSGELPDHHSDTETRRLSLDLESIGELTFNDGQLVVADPYLIDRSVSPIVQRLMPMPYEVIVARAAVGPDHARIAAAILVVGPEPIERWDMARWPDQDSSMLGRDEFFGYGVDAGAGCFSSPDAATAAGRVLEADGGMLEDPISTALLQGRVGTDSAAVVVPEADAEPIAVFSSGWGDGLYPTWLGMSGRGEVVIAVTDFLLTPDPYAALPP